MANTMAQHALLFCSIALLSIVIPIGIFIGRNNVRSTRGQLVDDLAKLFSFAREQGGLSGAPLRDLALDQLKRFRRIVKSELPLIAAGGIGSDADAWARIVAGASLVQLYSAMVYEGPGIALRIARGLAERARRAGFDNIAEAVGSTA